MRQMWRTLTKLLTASADAHPDITKVGVPPTDAPTIHVSDPLASYLTHKASIRNKLSTAVNYLGEEVIVGNDVTIWGGASSEVAGVELHDNVRIYDGCRLVVDHASKNSGIVLGKGVALNFNVYIDGSGGVSVGDGSIFGPNVCVLSSNHVIKSGLSYQNSGKLFRSVVIGHRVWIGANVVILAGVSIGDGAVIGAGSIVTRDVPPAALVVGNPARLLREL